MAVVKEYISEGGATIRIHDDAYRDKTPEELAAILKNINEVACRCLMAELERRAQEETA